MANDRRADERASASSDDKSPDLTQLQPATLQALATLYAQLAPAPLKREQRRRASAVIVGNAARLSINVATFRQRHGAALPELQNLPDTLAEQQRSADALHFLRAHLQLLLQRASDAYLSAQQQAVQQARAVLRRVYAVSTWHHSASPEFLLRQALLARAAPFDHRAPGRSLSGRRAAQASL